MPFILPLVFLLKLDAFNVSAQIIMMKFTSIKNNAIFSGKIVLVNVLHNVYAIENNIQISFHKQNFK